MQVDQEMLFEIILVRLYDNYPRYPQHFDSQLTISLGIQFP